MSAKKKKKKKMQAQLCPRFAPTINAAFCFTDPLSVFFLCFRDLLKNQRPKESEKGSKYKPEFVLHALPSGSLFAWPMDYVPPAPSKP